MVGRPVSRRLDDGLTLELLRLASDGAPNACSFLYSAARRATFAQGYTRLIIYILGSEPGVTLRAAGWIAMGTAGGGTWSRAGRPRSDTHPTVRKERWEVRACKEGRQRASSKTAMPAAIVKNGDASSSKGRGMSYPGGKAGAGVYHLATLFLRSWLRFWLRARRILWVETR
jgi:hypothetical protein